MKPTALFQTDRLAIELSPQADDGTQLLMVDGTLDENFNPKQALQKLDETLAPASALRLDTSHLERINSMGTKNWLVFLKGLEGKIPFRFATLGETMVDAAQVVPAVLGPKPIQAETCAVPYMCEKCGIRVSVYKSLTSPDLLSEDALENAAPACSKCGSPTAFDDLAETYQFLVQLTKKA